jgi:hypothetical protein
MYVMYLRTLNYLLETVYCYFILLLIADDLCGTLGNSNKIVKYMMCTAMDMKCIAAVIRLLTSSAIVNCV